MLPKFRTKKEREAKEKKTKRLLSILVISILALSVVAFALSSYGQNQSPGAGEEMYNGYKFTKQDYGWQTQVDELYVFTSYLPQEVENIKHSGFFALDDFKNIIYFVAKSKNEKKAANELDKMLLALKKDYACLPEYKNEPECQNLTLRSCEDASYIKKIIVFEENNETSIKHENNCVTIKGQGENILKAADKVIFLLYGIIKD